MRRRWFFAVGVFVLPWILAFVLPAHGGPTAPVSAGQIQGKPVSATAPTNNQLLQYVSATSTWTPTTLPGALLADPVPIANGGTGSASQNFVDLTTGQSIAGAKAFTTSLAANAIDTTAATPMTIGASSATGLTLSKTGTTTTNAGLTILGTATSDTLTINGTIQTSGVTGANLVGPKEASFIVGLQQSTTLSAVGGSFFDLAGTGADGSGGTAGAAGGGRTVTGGGGGAGTASAAPGSGGAVAVAGGVGGTDNGSGSATGGAASVTGGAGAGASGNGGSANISGGAKTGGGTDGATNIAAIRGVVNIGNTSNAVNLKGSTSVFGVNKLTVTASNGNIATATGATFAAGSNTLIGSVADKLNASMLAIASQAIGDLLAADSTTTFARLPDVAVNQVLASGGVGANPAYTATPTVTTLTGSTSLLTPLVDASSAGALTLGTTTATSISLRQNVTMPTGKTIVVGSNTLISSDQLAASQLLIGSQAIGDLLQASSTTAWARLADVAAGSYLRSGGVGASTLWSTLTLPNTATQGDLLTATGANAIGAVTAVAAGSYLRSNGTSAVPIYSTTTLPNTVATGNVLVATATNVVSAVTPASMVATPANQTGNATSTFKMNGLGNAAAPCVITTTTYSGRVLFSITGEFGNGTINDGVSIKFAYGTGTPPSNAGVAAGTVAGATQTFTNPNVASVIMSPGFSFTVPVTGLAASTATWFDLQIADVTGGTASVTNVTCSAHEF